MLSEFDQHIENLGKAYGNPEQLQRVLDEMEADLLLKTQDGEDLFRPVYEGISILRLAVNLTSPEYSEKIRKAIQANTEEPYLGTQRASCIKRSVRSGVTGGAVGCGVSAVLTLLNPGSCLFGGVAWGGVAGTTALV